MRETRTSGSEGGGGPIGPPYPYEPVEKWRSDQLLNVSRSEAPLAFKTWITVWRPKTFRCLSLWQDNVLGGQAASAAAPLLRPVLLV